LVANPCKKLFCILINFFYQDGVLFLWKILVWFFCVLRNPWLVLLSFFLALSVMNLFITSTFYLNFILLLCFNQNQL
jgi:hypothetical protein